jgi:hypothetical protein
VPWWSDEPAKLAGWGGSAGGITIGGAITQHPGLFAVAISQVGFNDMVDLENMPNGPGNVPEFGSVKTPGGFRDLLAMSAYDHVVAAPYPATMLTTGFNDQRSATWQVAKMAARLQASTTSGKPILLRPMRKGMAWCAKRQRRSTSTPTCGRSCCGNSAEAASNQRRRVDVRIWHTCLASVLPAWAKRQRISWDPRRSAHRRRGGRNPTPATRSMRHRSGSSVSPRPRSTYTIISAAAPAVASNAGARRPAPNLAS